MIIKFLTNLTFFFEIGNNFFNLLPHQKDFMELKILDLKTPEKPELLQHLEGTCFL